MNKIKEYVKITVIVLLVLVTYGIVGSIETHYTRDAEIIGYENDVVYLEDASGEQFAFYGKGYTKGDKVKVTYFNNCTLNRQDDKVIKVKTIKE